MSSTSRPVRAAVLTFVAISLTACAPAIHVNSYVERSADFSRYQTYDFAPPESVSTGDPRLDNNPFFQDRVRAATEKGLAARGYERPASGTPDLVVHFHASFVQEINVNDIDRINGYCTTEDCRPFVYDAGTLLLDFVDGHTNNLVWRGWVKRSMDGVVDNQAWMEQAVDDAVARILARLPPKS